MLTVPDVQSPPGVHVLILAGFDDAGRASRETYTCPECRIVVDVPTACPRCSGRRSWLRGK